MDRDTIANIKTLGLDMINNAKSGHPGIVLSSAPILYTLYKYHLNINPTDPTWYNRDRFIMSPGHGSALLYSILFMCGYDISLDDLKQFRTINSKTPGHPEYLTTPGVEATTGVLGEGLATAVGIALGEKILREKSKISKKSLIEFNNYVLVSDGDLMEGVSYEACSLAGTLNLDNLIILYDSNNMSLDGSIKYTFKEDVCKRFESFGFETFKVSDGNSIKQLNLAISKAKRCKKPSFIEIKTHLGDGSLIQDTKEVHGTPLTSEDLHQLKHRLAIPNEEFYVNEDLRCDLISFIANRVGDRYKDSINKYNEIIKPKLDNDLKCLRFYFTGEEYDISTIDFKDIKKNISMRDVNKEVLNKIVNKYSSIIGGSADLHTSTKTYIENGGDVTFKKYDSKNIWFGVREHALSSISNGLSLLSFRPFASTFLVFMDHALPSIRMSSIMNRPVIYIFTHDSVSIGKDGITHEPVEQLSHLRDIPNLDVYRPADLKEIVGAYQAILDRNNPSALIISRSDEIRLDKTSAKLTSYGGYVIKDIDNFDATLVASGSEVVTAIKLSYALKKNNINVRVVSMVSLELFLRQNKEYRENVLKDKKIIVLEASTAIHYTKITSYENIINITKFGASGESDDVLKYVDFDISSIYKRIYNIIKND